MAVHPNFFLRGMGLDSLEDEALPEGGRIDRAIFWPSFGPYCALTIRDFGEVGEVELIAHGLNSHHFLFSDLGPPEHWNETQTVPGEALAAFRFEMDEARPEALADVRPDYQYRDGIGFDAEVRRDGVYHHFDIHDDRDLWQANPAHERYFLAFWRLALEVLRDDWSRQVLDPRHFGDLLKEEADILFARKTKRRRS